MIEKLQQGISKKGYGVLENELVYVFFNEYAKPSGQISIVLKKR